jgi:AcrR family transcriptional regulator
VSNETDPRFLRSRQAILTAARELLLEHGPTAVTHARIAEHARIGRATVYRHWPRTDELLGEAMTAVPMPFFDAPRSPYRDWLTQELTALARQLEHDDVLAVTTTLVNAALWDPAMDARRAGFAAALGTRLEHALGEARQRGELAATDLGAAAALAIGPILYRAVIEHAPADRDLIDRCVASIGTWSRRPG